MTQMKIDCPRWGGEIDVRHAEGLSLTLREITSFAKTVVFARRRASKFRSRCLYRRCRARALRSKYGLRRILRNIQRKTGIKAQASRSDLSCSLDSRLAGSRLLARWRNHLCLSFLTSG